VRTLALALALLTLPLLADDTAPVATILCYHEVDPASEPGHDTIPRRTADGAATSEQLRYTATRENFVAQLDYLAANDYHVIPLAQLVGFLKGTVNALPPRAVVITVDDDWLCAYTEIRPELARRKLPFTLFIYPRHVGRGTHTISWAQVKELAKAGVDLESHTFSHPFLTLKNNHDVTPETYPQFLQHELVESRQAIEAQTGSKVRYLCYPYGDYDPAVMDAATKAGYEAALTTERGVITKSTPLLQLKRYLIHNDTTLEEFRGFVVR
jgi:peptidoglycan/xylan/chitin deacetylase (PgdA/CDA1 family)